jgi:hypothetical protein
MQELSFVGGSKVADNVLHIPEGGEYEAQTINLKQMFNRSTEPEHITNTPLLGICCYSQCFLNQ